MKQISMNFGAIKDTVYRYSSKTLVQENSAEITILNAFMNEIKKNPLLKKQHLIYKNFEEGYCKKENLAERYISQNLKLLEGYSWQEIVDLNKNIRYALLEQAHVEGQKGKEDFYTGDKFRFSDSMVLSDTFVSYNENNVLTDISITIPKNNMIALVGPSGSGKTTLVAVLTGLIPPDKGEFRIDNHLLSEYDLADFRSKIGYVSQDPVIFNDSIFNNVTLWDAKTELSLQKFNSVCRLTHLDEMINNLDKKEDSGTGDFGITLSGGQKQRISIARELYRDVELLVFDEATSSLDAITEQIIRENIQSIRGKVTIILIAHRLSTIRFADRIYFIEGGRITASGTYDELMQTSPDFLKMVNLQSG